MTIRKQDFERNDYVYFPPMSADEMKLVEDQLLKIKLDMESKKVGKPSQINTKSSQESKIKIEKIKKNFKKNNDTALRKFCYAYQEELNHACYEKIFYRFFDKRIIESHHKYAGQNKILNLLHQKFNLKVTENILIDDGWNYKSRKRYYVDYDYRHEFIQYLNDFIVPKFKTYDNDKS